MTGTISSTALAWLLTYAIHSTVLLSLAWLLVRTRGWAPAGSELIWKSAMIGAILTSSAQLYLDLRPAGTVMLESRVVATPPTTNAPVSPTFTTPVIKAYPATPSEPTGIASLSQPTSERSRPTIIMSR